MVREVDIIVYYPLSLPLTHKKNNLEVAIPFLHLSAGKA